MSKNILLTTGIVGSVIAALCCATPVLAVLLGALGLSAWIRGIDYVVLPALTVFLILVVYALIRSRAARPLATPDADTRV
jgi:mercuric ion transport protein